MNVSDKETRAVFLNFKELRNLEKNVQALDIEQAYSISLINLDQKLMKVSYKKLKDKVSRIRSHLKNDSIEELKELEDEGKLQFEKNASKVDFNIRIEAAAKRLKLQPRVQSAAPRLESRRTKSVVGKSRSTYFQTPTPRLSTAATPTVSTRTARAPSAPMSRSNSRIASARPVSPTAPLSPARSQVSIVIDEVPATNFPVPRSIRTERRQSIDIRCLTQQDTSKTSPLSVTISPPEEMRSRSGSILGIQDGVLSARRVSTCPESPPLKNTKASPKSPVGAKKTGDNQSGIWVSPRATFLQLPTEGEVSTSCTQNASFCTEDDKQSVCNIKVPGTNPQSTNSDSKARPMSVPSSKISKLDDEPKKKRPVTAAQLAMEARRKSIADIQRASTLLAEGKTRVPFSSHDLKAIELKAKEKKPFRSIREGTFSIGIESNVSDNTLGDDLHKEMKKGMLLGELATSLALEDKIDHFLERVDKYVKENPNYTYDPEKTKAELERIRQANKEAKKKKPKRNRFRRRQLQRRLQEENALTEAGKARYLRLSDDKLDISGVNTLVIDQMKMLRSLKAFDDSD